MGQKVHPIGFRLGISKPHLASWFAEKRHYGDKLISDLKIRQYIEKELRDSQLAKIIIGRRSRGGSKDKIEIYIYSGKPAAILGKGNERIVKIRKAISDISNVELNDVNLLVIAASNPDLEASLVARNIADQLENRIMFRRALRRAITNTMGAGAKGVKVMVSGRLGGADIARSETAREGRVPLHTLRANIDYALAEAHTTYGVIGVKVWIYNGDTEKQFLEVIPKQEGQNASAK